MFNIYSFGVIHLSQYVHKNETRIARSNYAIGPLSVKVFSLMTHIYGIIIANEIITRDTVPSVSVSAQTEQKIR